jgi:hypothetical protein
MSCLKNYGISVCLKIITSQKKQWFSKNIFIYHLSQSLVHYLIVLKFLRFFKIKNIYFIARSTKWTIRLGALFYIYICIFIPLTPPPPPSLPLRRKLFLITSSNVSLTRILYCVKSKYNKCVIRGKWYDEPFIEIIK